MILVRFLNLCHNWFRLWDLIKLIRELPKQILISDLNKLHIRLPTPYMTIISSVSQSAWRFQLTLLPSHYSQFLPRALFFGWWQLLLHAKEENLLLQEEEVRWHSIQERGNKGLESILGHFGVQCCRKHQLKKSQMMLGLQGLLVDWSQPRVPGQSVWRWDASTSSPALRCPVVGYGLAEAHVLYRPPMRDKMILLNLHAIYRTGSWRSFLNWWQNRILHQV